MKRYFGIGCLVFFVCSLLLVACKKEENFSVIPIITYKEFKKFGRDSATSTISFTDGDGDIGLAQFDTAAPFNANSKYFYNLYMDFYYLDSGVWKPFDSNRATPKMDTFRHTFRIPYLTQDGQRKSLEGDIRVRLDAPYIPFVPGSPPFKFKITLIDRAQHISNEVETPATTVP